MVFTHDRIWYETVRRRAPQWETRQLAGWSLEHGIRVLPAPGDQLDRVKDAIRQGQADTAANLARSWAEAALKKLSERIRVPLPYRAGYANEERTPHELFRYLHTAVQTKNRFTPEG